MVVAFSFVCGAFLMAILLFIMSKYVPGKVDSTYKDRHLEIVEKQLLVFNERVVEERRLANALETIVAQITSTNTGSPKLPCFEDVVLSVKLPWKSMSIISTKTQIDIAKAVYDYIAGQLRAGA